MKKPLLFLGMVVLFGCSSKSITNQQMSQKDAYDSAAVETAMLANRFQYRACYENQFSQSKRWPAGRVITQFNIGEDGKVLSAGIKESTLKQPSVENCLLEIIKKTQFPKPEKHGTVSVEYPFKFQGKES